MKFLLSIIVVLLPACSTTYATNRRVDLSPAARHVANMESGFRLLKNIELVGVYDSKAMNREAKVRIRSLNCEPQAFSGTAVCKYEANRCLETEVDLNYDGWCARTSQFIRDPTSVAPVSSGGWTLQRPL